MPPVTEVRNETIWEQLGQYFWRAAPSEPPWQRISATLTIGPAQANETNSASFDAENSTEPASSPVAPLKQTLAEILLRVISVGTALADASLSRNISVGYGSAVDSVDSVGGSNLSRSHQRVRMQPVFRRTRRSAALRDAQHLQRRPCASGESIMQEATPNFHLTGLLRRLGYQVAEDVPRMASRQTIKAMVALLQKNPEEKAAVAEHILRDLGFYGGDENEYVSEEYQSQVVNDLIVREIFGGNINDFVVAQLTAREDKSSLTTDDLSNVLHKRLYECLFRKDGNTQDDLLDFEIYYWIWQHVLLRVLPVLRFEKDEQGRLLSLNEPDWGQMHAGLAFLEATDMDVATISQEEALAAGKMLQAQLNKEVVLPEWRDFFLLPAQCHAIMSRTDQQRRPEQSGQGMVAAYFAYVDGFVNARCPLLKFKKLMSGYQTRRQLAQPLVEKYCTGSDVESLLRSGINICSGDPAVDHLHVNTIYEKQVKEIADAFETVDQLLFASAWARLADAEIDFINTAEIQRVEAEFIGKGPIKFKPMGVQVVMADELLRVPTMPSMELFAARRGGEERIYVSRKTALGYDVERIDRNRNKYLDLVADSRPRNRSDFVLWINKLGEKFEQKELMLSEICRRGVSSHKENFYRQLYDFGYEKSTSEHVVDFVLDLIPFYSCINAYKTGDHEKAGLACAIDIVTMIPIIGMAGKLSLKLGETIARGTLVSIQKVVSEISMRHTLTAAIRAGGTDFVRYGLRPAAKVVGREEMVGLGRTLFDAFDPGVQIIGLIGRQSLRQAIKLGHIMETNLPALKELLRKLETRLEQRLRKPQVAPDAMGMLPGTGHQVSVKHIPNQYFHAKAIYVQMHPETGALFGRKYTLAADGQLEAIPIPIRSRLANIREQGFGGRGAGEASRSWADESPSDAAALTNAEGVRTGVISAQWLRTVQSRPLGVGGRAQLARQQGVAESALARYLDEQGQLTAEGRAMLARADAVEVGTSRDSASAAVASVNLAVGHQYQVVTDSHVQAWLALSDQQRATLGLDNFCQMYNVDAATFREFLTRPRVLDLSVPHTSGSLQQASAASDSFGAPLPPVHQVADTFGTQLPPVRQVAVVKPMLLNGLPVTEEFLTQWRGLVSQRDSAVSQLDLLLQHQLNQQQLVREVDRPGHIRQNARTDILRSSGVDGHGQPSMPVGHGQPSEAADILRLRELVDTMHSAPAGNIWRHSQPSAAVGHSQYGAPVGHSQPSAAVGHSQYGAPVGHSQPSAVVGHSQPSAVVGHSQYGVPVSHSQPGAAVGHSQPVAVVGHSQPSAVVGHSQPSAVVGHSQPSAVVGHSQPSAVVGHSQPSAAVGHSQYGVPVSRSQPGAAVGRRWKSAPASPSRQEARGAGVANPPARGGHRRSGHHYTKVTDIVLEKWQKFIAAHPEQKTNQKLFITMHNLNQADWVNYVNPAGDIIRPAPLRHPVRGSKAPKAKKRDHDEHATPPPAP